MIEKETVELIIGKLEGISQKLGITAEYLWGTMVKQAYIDFSANMIWICVYLVFLATYLVYLKTYSMKTMTSMKDDEGKKMSYTRLTNGYTDAAVNCIISSIFGIVAIVLTAVIVGNIRGIMTAYFNPEYWAFAKLMYLIN